MESTVLFIHAHTTNTICTYLCLPLEDRVFTRELWESATECPVGIPGWCRCHRLDGSKVEEKCESKPTELMKKYDVVIWAHHGMFCSGEDFDLTFGLLHTVGKSAEILVKVMSMAPRKLQTITPD